MCARPSKYPADMDKNETAPENRPEEGEVLDAKTCLIAGAGVGAFGAASALTVGAVCPLCIVAAPALLGIGAFKHYRRRRAKRNQRP